MTQVDLNDHAQHALNQSEGDVSEALEAIVEQTEALADKLVDAVVSEPVGTKAPTKKEILLQLFLSTLYISACTFGGGFVIITFMKRKFVDTLHWIEEEEMLDLTALAQSSPGAIAVNAAILVGWRMGGFIGMITAVLGTIIPPMSILIAISFCYTAFASNRFVALTLQCMQAGVAAVIFDVVIDLGGNVLKEKNWVSTALMVSAFCVAFFLSVNVVYIILAAACLGAIKAVCIAKKGADA